MRKPYSNWPAVRSDYEQTAAPLRMIATKHGLSHTAIRKRAKTEDWARGAAPIEAPSPEVLAQVGSKPLAPKPRKRSPKRILEDIAADQLVPAAARVAACKVLLGMEKPSEEAKAREAHDRVT